MNPVRRVNFDRYPTTPPSPPVFDLIVSGTGHRPDKLGGYSAEARQKLESFAEKIVIQLKPKKLYSGFAQGWDLALAEAAVRCGVPLIAAIPFGGQEYLWPAEAQERYRTLLRKAATVRLVCEGGYAAWKMQRRNEYLVTSSNLVVALWDGSDGGTANCLRYAEKSGRKMLEMPEALIAAECMPGGLTNVWDQWKAAA